MARVCGDCEHFAAAGCPQCGGDYCRKQERNLAGKDDPQAAGCDDFSKRERSEDG
jgi:hypothetical protein